MDAFPEERPHIRVLMVKAKGRVIEQTQVVDLLDVRWYQRLGFSWVAMDPSDERSWLEWRERHPEAS